MSGLAQPLPNFITLLKGDYCNMDSYLLDHDFDTIESSSSVEWSWLFLKSKLFDARHLFVPMITLSRKQTPKWFTSDIRHEFKCIKTLRRKSKKKPSPSIKAKLDTLETHLQSLILSAKVGLIWRISCLFIFITPNASSQESVKGRFTSMSNS